MIQFHREPYLVKGLEIMVTHVSDNYIRRTALWNHDKFGRLRAVEYLRRECKTFGYCGDGLHVTGTTRGVFVSDGFINPYIRDDEQNCNFQRVTYSQLLDFILWEREKVKQTALSNFFERGTKIIVSTK